MTKLLFTNARLLDNRFAFVAVEGKRISYIGEERPEGQFDRVIDCRGNLLMNGFYNTHCHAAMTLFRGYGEDMPLREWLDTRILPAEDRLDDDKVYYGTLLAIAEMLSSGIVSFSDMYFFCDKTARAVLDSGIKANVSRSLVSFEEGMTAKNDSRFLEGISLYKTYHGEDDGRLRIDMSIHAEYSNVESYIREVSDYTAREGMRMQLHLSETEKEHKECILRRGKTPTEFFYDCGTFQAPTTCAHGVFLTESDMDILARCGATVSHNPCSNLKLGSGVARVSTMMAHGVNVAIGTDGVASNNSLDFFREMYVASLIAKGISNDPTVGRAEDILRMATLNGARSQGREDCGEMKVGNRADLVLVSLEDINTMPSYDLKYTVLYAAKAANVKMTMVDGTVVYENGSYPTMDIEKIKDGFKRVCDY